MPNILIQTKINVPTPRPNFIIRPLLINKLQAGLTSGGRLSLISAPAGYGKTSIVSAWINQYHHPAAWISLDEHDNDIVRFVNYLTAAIRTVIPEVSEQLGPLLETSQSTTIEPVLSSLLNKISKSNKQLILVLDDYHQINNRVIHDSIQFLLENLPPNTHLVIITRADPPFSISLLRGRGLVTELRLNDLRFSSSETEQFFESILNKNLSSESLQALESRIEGWVTGLQMAAVSMQGHQDNDEFVRSFIGSSRFILDFLIDEVLLQQPPDIQNFLILTSILKQFCAPLCKTIIEKNDDTNKILDYLESANLFIIPLDDQRCWYRYHRLFKDLLFQRLVKQYPDQIPGLHKRASLWFESQGNIEDAIEHALLSGEFSRSAGLIEQIAETVLLRGETTIFLGWIDLLPEEELFARPDLAIYHSWALLWKGSSFKDIENNLNQISENEISSIKLKVLYASMAVFQGNVTGAIELSSQALEQLPEPNSFFYLLTKLLQAKSFLSQYDSDIGKQALLETVRLSQQSGNMFMAALVLCNLGELLQKQLQLKTAESYFKHALEIATDPEGNRLPVAGMALIGWSDLLREWNELARAEKLVREGIELVSQWSTFSIFEGQIVLAMILEARKEVEEAQKCIESARKLSRQITITEIDDLIVDMIEARLFINHGDLEATRRWAAIRGLEDLDLTHPTIVIDDPSARMRRYEYPVLARLMLAEGNYSQAISLTDFMIVLAEKTDRPFLALEAKTLKMLAFHAHGQTEPAFDILEQILSAAEPQNLIRFFLDEGERMREVLTEYQPLAKDKTVKKYIRMLLSAFNSKNETGKNAGKGAPPSLIEPLSDREVDVLHLLPASLTTVEMAEELNISVNTVRSHIKKIYSKLGVNSRHQAIDKARDVGLL